MKTSVITYIVGAAVTIVSLVLTWIFDQSARSTILSVALPILAVLIVDRISNFLRQAEDMEAFAKLIRREIPQSSAIVMMERSADAMRYLTQQIARAKRFHNIRVVARDIDDADPLNRQVTQQLDSAIRVGLSRGIEYRWIHSAEYVDEACALMAYRDSMATSSTNPGEVDCFTLRRDYTPEFNFAILEYAEGAEVVFGWSIKSTGSFAMPVFVVSDRRFVDYCLQLFEVYLRNCDSTQRIAGAPAVEGSTTARVDPI